MSDEKASDRTTAATAPAANPAEWQERLRAGSRAFEAGNYADAAARFEAALKLAEAFGYRDARFARTLRALAGAYAAQGRTEEAERVFLQVLPLEESISGAQSGPVARTLADLGALYAATDRIDLAEANYRRAIDIFARSGDAAAMPLAATLNNLGLLYKSRRRFAEALPLFERALRIALKGSGPVQPFVATMLNNLGAICLGEGKLAEAGAFLRHALEINEKALGSDHRDVATILNNLGELRRAEGQPAEARRLYARVLSIDERVYGPNHPEVAADLMQLGAASAACGDIEAAQEEYRRALSIRESLLGHDHRLTMEARGKLSELERNAQNIASVSPQPQPAAERQGAELILVSAAEPGMERPAAAQRLCETAERYNGEKQWAEAERHYRKELDVERSTAAPQAACVAATLNNLGCSRQRQGATEDAAVLFQESLRASLNMAHSENDLAATALNNLASVCASRGRYTEAESLYLRAVQLDAEALPANQHRAIVEANLAALRQAP